MKAARKASRRGAKRVRTQPVLDSITRVLIENGVPVTQRVWCGRIKWCLITRSI